MSLFLAGAVNGGSSAAIQNGFGTFFAVYSHGDRLLSLDVTLSRTFNYTGVGPGSVLVNVNVQDFANGTPTVLYADAIHVEQVAEPGTLSLLGAGLVALG